MDWSCGSLHNIKKRQRASSISKSVTFTQSITTIQSMTWYHVQPVHITWRYRRNFNSCQRSYPSINVPQGKLKKKLFLFYWEKDKDCLKAHVTANLADENKPIHTNLYMNMYYKYKEFKKRIKHYWWINLGWKEYLKTGKRYTKATEDSEIALNTISSEGRTRFPSKYRKCGSRWYPISQTKAIL